MMLYEFIESKARRLALLLVVMVFAGCEAGQPGLGQASGSVAGSVGGIATPLSDAEYRSMTTDQQYKILNKLMSTLYKGVPVMDFYDLSDGMSKARLDNPDMTPNAIRQKLQTNMADSLRARFDLEILGDEEARDNAGNSAPIEGKFYFDDNRPKQMPLARIVTYPLSRNGYSQWIAWNLANTILFSPAEEIDSADITDVQNLFRRLDLSIMNRRSIREIIATHQRTVENWRRFRSPEDNTREMMEIYLGLFDNDDDVPHASKACQDLYLTDESEGYKLAYTDFPNSEAQLVLDQYVTTCGEFYDVVAGHPLLIPRVVSVLVDYFFAGTETDYRLAMVESISRSNPQTFEDVFTAILFSRSYLLDVERPKSFEESYLGMAARLNWQAHKDVFRGMTGGQGGVSRTDMREMGWPSMSLKLGRITDIPLDSLSFANYHKAMRETLMLDRSRWRSALGLQKPEAPDPRPIDPLPSDASSREIAAHAAATQEYVQAVAALPANERAAYDIDLADYEEQLDVYSLVDSLSVPEVIDYLFLSAVQRRANEIERKDLTAIVARNDHIEVEFGQAFVRSGRLDDAAQIILDYLSRLPEAYYLSSIE